VGNDAVVLYLIHPEKCLI